MGRSALLPAASAGIIVRAHVCMRACERLCVRKTASLADWAGWCVYLWISCVGSLSTDWMTRGPLTHLRTCAHFTATHGIPHNRATPWLQATLAATSPAMAHAKGRWRPIRRHL